jgi:hypothetical protein
VGVVAPTCANQYHSALEYTFITITHDCGDAAFDRRITVRVDMVTTDEAVPLDRPGAMDWTVICGMSAAGQGDGILYAFSLNRESLPSSFSYNRDLIRQNMP